MPSVRWQTERIATKMWDALAGLVAQGAHRTPAYEDAMVLAHDVMDALMKSAANGGALVPIPEDA